eukprot:141035-Chlamydomonas_euryale.AAC.2
MPRLLPYLSAEPRMITPLVCAHHVCADDAPCACMHVLHAHEAHLTLAPPPSIPPRTTTGWGERGRGHWPLPHCIVHDACRRLSSRDRRVYKRWGMLNE